jgi:HEAT repeat protein
LAELLLSQSKTDEADQLLRRVVRAAPDEDLVAQAARLSMQVNLGRGTLESLEKELLPVALGNPGRPLYRRLLVEVYGAMAFPLVHQAQSGKPEQANAARDALRRIGERAVKPLLDALSDERDAQQRTAIELLAHIENKGAGPALYAYAMGDGEPGMRVRAMLAVGALEDPTLLPRLEAVLLDAGSVRGDESDPVAVAAAWSVARMRHPKALPLLLRLVHSEAPSIRALAALGLGFLKEKPAAASLQAVAQALDAGPLPRAAAAYSLGELGYANASETLAQLAEASDPLIRAQATIALARLDAKNAPSTIAQNLVSTEPELARAAIAAALVLTTRRYELQGDPLDSVMGQIQVEQLLKSMIPVRYSVSEHAAALVKLAEPIAEAAVTAAQSSPERARAVLELLLARGGKPAFGQLTQAIDQLPASEAKAALLVAERIQSEAVTPFVMLAHHPTPDVRAQSVRFLAHRPEPAARAAVVDTLLDPDTGVQRAALEAVQRAKLAAPAAAVRRLLGKQHAWPIRAHAARTLGVLRTDGQKSRVAEALTQSALSDDYALVRQAALSALYRVDGKAATPVAKRLAENDPEPKVRQLATELLSRANP